MSAKIPRTWQLAAKARFVAREIMALVADCGVGKTFAAILIALAKNMPVIVIAPTHRLCEQWKEEIEETLGDEADVWVYAKPDETKQGDYYRERFEAWLTT
jgi:superfamily II DNA or RNA helicase